MAFQTTRRVFLGLLGAAGVWLLSPAFGQTTTPRAGRRDRGRGQADDYTLPTELAAFGLFSAVLGRATNKSMVLNLLASEPMETYVEYGTTSGEYSHKTPVVKLTSGIPSEVILENLKSDSAYFYRVQNRKSGEATFAVCPESRFHTQRAAGSAFTFCIQGDSHPERPQMSHPELYARTLNRVAMEQPDFYFCMGDDFSIEKIREFTADTVAQRYLLQRPFLSAVAQSASLYLLNGNHEQASLYNYNQSGVPHDAAVHAQNARNRYFPMPAPDGFYTGNAEELKDIGLLRNYFAWTWGDALFVVLDNYWHSPALVDSALDAQGVDDPNVKKNRDWWSITLGDKQYQWLKKTLEESKATHKFVFTHHVLGSGRGGVEECDLYEWGGKNRRGDDEFQQKRPGWELPIHQLMVKHGVTIFFQGHDHLYARQERDGVVYQEVPMPADHGYTAYNQERYVNGTKLPNSGYLRVTVAPDQVKVDYVRCFLSKDENDAQKTGDIAHSYVIKTKIHA